MINGAVLLPIGPWLQEKEKIDIPPILPIDLTPVYESNTISIMILIKARDRLSLESDHSRVK
jgi:hypothetical protein